MKSIKLFLFTALVTLFACNNNSTAKWEQEIKDADSAFSDLCVQKGVRESFLHYAANDVVLLKPNMHPIVGHSKLEEHYQGRVDTAFVLKWVPSYAIASKSGDLGYSYGIWEYYFKSNPTEINRGTYLTVWQR